MPAPMQNATAPQTAAIIGGGPSGLMAAEVLSQAGIKVTVFDAMPSVGRKFLLAGIGGMNISNAEPLDLFTSRYGARQAAIAPMLERFSPSSIRTWCDGLGVSTFVGSSGRIFPEGMKAAPLLRKWLHRLRSNGVSIQVNHRWQGWNADQSLHFHTATGDIATTADAVILALGGGSWPQLGSNGAWVELLSNRNITVAPLRPANCGFDCTWSTYFAQHYAGHPLKSISARLASPKLNAPIQGELMITHNGVEGGIVYNLSAQLRDALLTQGQATLLLDLLPNHNLASISSKLAHNKAKRSFANHLRQNLGLTGVKAGLLRECFPQANTASPEQLALAIKSLPLTLTATRPLAEAISSAGGVAFEALDNQLMLQALPGVFCAGEMLDWEAPTGGYLLTACLASGRVAGQGALDWLNARQ